MFVLCFRDFLLQSTVLGFSALIDTVPLRTGLPNGFDLLIASSMQSKTFSASLNYTALVVLISCTATSDCQSAGTLCGQLSSCMRKQVSEIPY